MASSKTGPGHAGKHITAEGPLLPGAETQAMMLKASRLLPAAGLRPVSQAFLQLIDEGLAGAGDRTEQDLLQRSGREAGGAASG
jgi:hypothetical protein